MKAVNFTKPNINLVQLVYGEHTIEISSIYNTIVINATPDSYPNLEVAATIEGGNNGTDFNLSLFEIETTETEWKAFCESGEGFFNESYSKSVELKIFEHFPESEFSAPQKPSFLILDAVMEYVQNITNL